MLSLLKKILGIETNPISMTVREAIELVVDESIHKIRLIGGYRKKLRQPVETALSHCADLAKQIPATLDISAKDKTSMALINGFFNDPDQVRKVVSESSDLKDFLDQKKADALYLVMTMQRLEKTTFGSSVQGEIVVRDVIENAIYFEDHKVILPAETIEEAFHSISLGLLKVLAHQALEHTLAMQKRELELEKLQDEVAVKLKILEKDRKQMAFESIDAESKNLVVESQNLLDGIEKELGQVETITIQPDFYLNQLIEVLSHPGQYISVNLIPMRINRLGFFVKEPSCSAEGTICIAEFNIGAKERRSVVLIKCHRDQLERLP